MPSFRRQMSLLIALVVLLLAVRAEQAPRIKRPAKHVRSASALLEKALDLQRAELRQVRQALEQGDHAAAGRELLAYYKARPSPLDPQVKHWSAVKDKGFVDYWLQDATEFPQRYGHKGRINWRNDNRPPRGEYESYEIRNRLINLAGWTAAANLAKVAALRQQVVETFLDWYRDCPAPELPVTGWWDGHKTGFAWQEIEVAWRGRMLLSIFFASLDWPEAQTEFHQSLLLAIHQCADFLTDLYARFGFKAHNHQSFHGMMLLAAGVLLPEMKAATAWKELGLHILKQHAQSDFYPDGVQVEGSPHYHAWVFFAYLDAYEVLLAEGKNNAEDLAWLRKHLQHSADFLLYSCDSDGRVVPLNDSWHTSNYALLQRAAQVLDRPDLLALSGLLPAEKTPPLSRVFPQAGFAFLRSGWHKQAVVVAVDASSHRSGHYHCGKPHFVIHAGGQVLACDPQLANYDDPSYWQYFKRAEAHNTILVDGQGDSEPAAAWTYKRLSKPQLQAFRSSETVDIVCASTDGFASMKPPVVWQRTILFIKPATVWVHDVLRSSGQHRYEWLLHLTPQQPLVDPVAKTLRTNTSGRYQLVVQPAPGGSSITGPSLRMGKHHDRHYPPQVGYWFPLQYGDVPAPITDAPYAVWMHSAEGTTVLDFVLDIVESGQKPVLVRKLDFQAEKLVSAYQVGGQTQSLVIIFDDRPDSQRSTVQVGKLRLRGRVGAGTERQWVTIP